MITPEIGKYYWIRTRNKLVVAKFNAKDGFGDDNPEIIQEVKPPVISFAEYSCSAEEIQGMAESKLLVDMWDSLGYDAKLARFEHRLAAVETKLYDRKLGEVQKRLNSIESRLEVMAWEKAVSTMTGKKAEDLVDSQSLSGVKWENGKWKTVEKDAQDPFYMTSTKEVKRKREED